MPVIGKGHTISFGTFSGQLRGISFSGIAADRVMTDHAGVADGYKTSVPGLIDPGTVTVEVLFNPATDMSSLIGGATNTLQITFSDGSKMSCTAYISQYTPRVGYGELGVADVTFQAVSKWTHTAA